ncbi:guanylate-binding protein 4-like isoform X2 [Bos indicus x Bos taurus]|uniref:guanylate-binding protein 4-like isoform X2 n=1 Tax=Bos indicus x Bos taurus TaxID=30522 RepID=UPI000F7D0A42|nr:guanylate-binding protein 4-like isoform X2 [Bos indicus x Bos taurus]
MASEIHMPGPECLIKNINGQLLVNPEALKILSAIKQPVVVVAIVGLYRTGKSYLMNKLAGKNKGFSVGSTVQSHTKGIWMWCVPHPKKPDHTLVLLDTEGLGDVEKGDNQNDSWIFALAVLLSSTFVYNSIGTINQQAMDQLHYVTELTRRIRAKSSPDKHEVLDSANFVSFFPDFVWTLRDFSLELVADGQPITADEYLEYSLKLKQGNDKKTKNFNEPRLCIRKFFPEKKCFIFDRPAHRKYLIHLEQLQEEDLNPKFREQVADFCFYILSHSKAKTLSGGITVNGPRLESLVLTYVNSISSGDLPCMESAVLALAEIENLAAVQKAIAHYDQQMDQKLKLPTETLQELLDLHRATEKEAIEVFMKNCFKDVDQVFQKKLGDKLEAKLDDFCKQNMKASSDYCMALIQDICHPLYEDVKQGTFFKPGAYYLFIKKMNEPKNKYHQVPRKGVQTGETLRKYLDSKEDVADALLQIDQLLTEKEKEIEVERMKYEAANKILEEMQKKNEQMMREKEASYQEHVKQLTEKMEKERAQLIAEQERVLALQVLMASGSIKMDPIYLVENRKSQLSVNPKALKILHQISQPLVVVAITGLYQTGKSYLMNRLAGQNHGFRLGSTVRSETKGIWMWCVPHPSKENHTLVLLDTEGLGNVEKDSKNDLWIFALAVLLSSTLIYNSMNSINDQALQQLHYVTELTELIRSKSSPSSDKVEDSARFVSFFPDFIWTVRDFMLELKLDGSSITEDEYLENALKLIPDKGPQIQNLNLPRECIRKFFPKRKCFVFDRPASNKKQLLHLEEMPDNQLDEDFQKQSKDFCSYIYTHAKTKTLKEGITVTGKRLGPLVEAYVNAINSGSVPCLENAVTTLAQLENSAAVQKAADHYSEQMAQRLSLPIDALQELLEVHTACEKEAIAVFMEHSFKDENQDFQKKLAIMIDKKKDDFLLQNEEASVRYCQTEFKKLSEPLMTSISEGTFLVPGGHHCYLEARNKFEENYKLIPRKGVKANQVLQSFLQSQAEVEAAILKVDQALTDADKAMAEERTKRQAAEMKQDLLTQELNDEKQKMEAQERSHKENIAQVKEKLEMERENLLREQEAVLAHKLKIQEEMLTEGFERKANELHEEILQLQKEIEKTKDDRLLENVRLLTQIGLILMASRSRFLNCV